jgi:hypothetical protein
MEEHSYRSADLLGQVDPYVDPNTGTTLWSVFTQVDYGDPRPTPYADLLAIGQGMNTVMHLSRSNVAIPKVGAGRGGLPWDHVEAVLLSVERRHAGREFWVYEVEETR